MSVLAPLVLLLAAASAPPAEVLEVAVLPARGTATEAAKLEVTRALSAALSAYDGLAVVSLESVDSLLGPDAARVIGACEDDACLVRETARIRSDLLVASTVDAGAGSRVILRVRSVDTSSAAHGPLVRVSREIPDVEARGALALAAAEVAEELFPEQAARSFGAVALTGAPAGAEVFVDGRRAPHLAPIEAGLTLRLTPGAHRLDVVAPGHRGFGRDVSVRAGQTTPIEVTMEKNRSSTPWLLGGVGVVAGGVALGLGALAEGTAGDWDGACTTGRCAPGFTRERYDDDRATVDRLRVSANGLLVVSAVAVVAGVVWFLLDPGVDEATP